MYSTHPLHHDGSEGSPSAASNITLWPASQAGHESNRPPALYATCNAVWYTAPEYASFISNYYD